MSKKSPPNAPERGDRCVMRGNREQSGMLSKYDPETNWATVEWDADVSGPLMCHRFELERRSE